MTEPFICPRCGRASYHPIDRTEGYCGHCHDFVDSRPAEVLSTEQRRIQKWQWRAFVTVLIVAWLSSWYAMSFYWTAPWWASLVLFIPGLVVGHQLARFQHRHGL